MFLTLRGALVCDVAASAPPNTSAMMGSSPNVIRRMFSLYVIVLLLVRRLNRRGVVNEKVIRKWCSDPHRPRVMRSCSQGQRRSVDRGTCGPGIQPRKKLPPGRRRCKEKRKAPSGAPISRGGPEPRAVRDPVHLRSYAVRDPGDPMFAQACSCLGTRREV